MAFRTLVVWPLLIAPLVSAAQEPSGARISVVGLVYDSVASRPLGDALVQLVPASDLRAARSAISDTRGRYRIDSLVPGEYFVSFFHPAADSLGIQAPVRRVSLGARDPETVDLALPAVRRIVAALCPELPPDDSSAVMIGEVRDADTRAPIANATVIADWATIVVDAKGLRIEPSLVRTTTTEIGAFTLCGLLPGDVAAQAMSEARVSGKLEVAIEPRTVVRRDFTLAEGTTFETLIAKAADGERRVDTVLRGPGRLTGIVLDESARPVREAIVRVWETSLSTRTDDSGRFELTRLPVGTHVLEVRRIGFAPYRLPIQLASLSPTSVSVALDKPVRQLDEVRVSARTIYSRRQREIERRRQTSIGHFIMRDELERSANSRITDLLRQVPGVRVLTGVSGNVVTFTRAVNAAGPCQPTLYFDGHRLGAAEDLDDYGPVRMLEAIEIYPSGMHGPAEFFSSCGAIVLWTRIEPRYPKVPRPKPPKKDAP